MKGSWVGECLRKTAFNSIDTANKAVDRALSQRSIQLYIYTCPHCSRLHLTRMKDARKGQQHQRVNNEQEIKEETNE